MSNKPENPAAFPLFAPEGKYRGEVSREGMTLRDYFAAHAPITLDDARASLSDRGYIASCDDLDGYQADAFARLAQMRIAYADAMLKARSKP